MRDSRRGRTGGAKDVLDAAIEVVLEIVFGVALMAVAVAVVLWIGVAITRGAYLIVANVTGIANMLR